MVCDDIVLRTQKSNEPRRVTERRIAEYLIDRQRLVSEQSDLEHVITGFTAPAITSDFLLLVQEIDD